MTQGHATKANMKENKTQLENPIGLNGMEFIEYATPNIQAMELLFKSLGFSKIGTHKHKKVTLWSQGRVHFILNSETDSFAQKFSTEHGPSVCATGFRVKNAEHAFEEALRRGARPCPASKHHSFPAIYGIGNSIVYFVESGLNDKPYSAYAEDFNLSTQELVPAFGLEVIDHLTNNVPSGEMQQWCDFYQKIFNFREVRYFDIKGKKTGLISKVMRSPCNKIIIPINEPTDEKSQIQEYLNEYRGSGIQHIALLTNDIIATVKKLKSQGIEFLSTPETYYEKLLSRVPGATEDVDQLKANGILVDGDAGGYLLQIFTQNLIGPIFYEIIQRKNHDGFGEGNFQALFDSIEEDQRRRGFLKD
jgi:4-hydroxyphenylpyruvate dioxygenase